MADFKVALFDLDGTLIDSEPQYTHFWDVIGAELGLRPDFATIIKGSTVQAMFDKYIQTPELQREIEKRLDDYEQQMDFPFIPGALEFIHDVREHGVRCAVVTSSNQKKIGHLKRSVPQFEGLFDSVLTAEDFAASKPAPDCYLQGAHRFGVSEQDCVVFEDAPAGLKAGVAAGMFTIGFATGHPRSVIQSLCHRVEDDFAGLDFQQVSDLLKKHWI